MQQLWTKVLILKPRLEFFNAFEAVTWLLLITIAFLSQELKPGDNLYTINLY